MIKLLSIADIISLSNACFGFLAIVMGFLGKTWFSFSFIFIALLADGLDGIVARKTRHSELGEYLEAMADMTSLGIAPAFFVYITYYDVVSWSIYYHSFLIILIIMFLSLNIIRLASFHIMEDKNFFVGLPASSSTIIILILASFKINFIYILPIIIIISIAMISNVHFPKLGLKTDIISALLIILTLILGKDYYGVAPLLLITAVMIYAIFGPVYLLKSK